MKYRIRDLENFVVAAQNSTIIEAAKLLGIGQPALSESIQRLEADCGQTLFYRSRTGIQLTSQGRAFFSSTQKALGALRELEAPSVEGQVFGNQEISIGCFSTVAIYTLPVALADLKLKAPDFKISLRHDLSRNIQTEVQRGRIDVGIVINPTSVPDLVIKEMGRDLVSVWTDKLSSEHDTIICNPNLIQTQAILKKWKKKPAKIISTDSLELVCHLVAKGIGYGIIPERAVQISAPSLKKVSSLPDFTDTIAIVYRPEFGKNQAEKFLLESLKKALG
jgi:DNA-binding transcriptional LysR family regulator